MNFHPSLAEFKQWITGKHAAVLGFGVSNQPLTRWLLQCGANVTIYEKNDIRDLSAYMDLKETWPETLWLECGAEYLESLHGVDVIFRSPGIRYDLPQIQREVDRGAWLISEMELFVQYCPAHVTAVTGSDGKTTTTTLISKILAAAGYRVWVGGNIGMPLLDKIEEIRPDDRVVLELSSFQLHTMRKSPDVAVVTNLSPNHLDVHRDYAEYKEAKANILKYQTQEGVLILNHGNPDSAAFQSDACGKIRWFSLSGQNEDGACLSGSVLGWMMEGHFTPVVKAADIRIPGMHNVENYLAAMAAVLGTVKPEHVADVATGFGGVEHRLECVREIRGVRYYNSSIDSSPNRTVNALRVFPERVILIAGGKDKGIPYDDMGPAVCQHVSHLILTGQTAGAIREAVQKSVRNGGVAPQSITEVASMDEAVRLASHIASENDVVLLSPASTSFDKYKNFEERGRHFKTCVNSL